MLPIIALHRLHDCTIDVEIEINRQPRFLRGIGAYIYWPDMGWVLRIAIEDLAGGFTFILRESQWEGEIQRSDSPEVDYHICLNPQRDVC